jgi:tetratricopeptide (TPR) repeat protein
MNKNMIITAFFAVSILGCTRVEKVSEIIPLYENLSMYERKVSTNSKEAQAYFNQGFTLYYGFNHEAAIKSFQQVLLYDSTCAMAWWGQAISVGPHINNPVMDSLARATAWETILKAQSKIDGSTPLEKSLIDALARRYAWPAPDDRKPLDSAYADAMRTVYEQHPDDPDVGALFADALMNLRPWDYWTPEGDAQPGTEELVAVIEHVLALQPEHPGACHFYIHTIEASPFPEKALPYADRLRERIPGAGHLVHMPSHIDIRLGRYQESILANQKAILADSLWISQPGFYTIYIAHNYHFLAYSAMFSGQKDIAMRAANSIPIVIPMDLVTAYPDYLDAFLAVPTHVMVRFGMWDELLAVPGPASEVSVTKATWHYGRTIAFSALGRIQEAEAEFDSLSLAYSRIPDSRLVGNNPARTVLEIGLLMAEGELEYRKRNFDKSFGLLSQAVEKDDALRYDEPWGWMMPVRHALGALLTEQGRYKEAIAVYEQDLVLHPGNGWALKGLADCYALSGNDPEAEQTAKLFQEAWNYADVPIKASCYCARGDI